MGDPIKSPITSKTDDDGANPITALDFGKLDELRENADAALEWLNAREPMDDKFKEASQCRSALAIYHDALKRAAPELIRLARIGAEIQQEQTGET